VARTAVAVATSKKSGTTTTTMTTKKPRERRAPFIGRTRIENDDDGGEGGDGNDDPTSGGGVVAVRGNEPDGNGGLDRPPPPPPWTVEYSKTGRATCRTCDERILRGEVRVGHAPPFRGKPGFVVYRHLRCAVFPGGVARAEDVVGHGDLSDDDMTALSDRIITSRTLILEEGTEIRPDELVNDTFRMEDVCTRAEPGGLNARLLPFQLEGYNWMRYRETTGAPRGGILADEMVSI
jgi:hypothetical protein